MHLVIFDIDGTLTETMNVDDRCFVRSFMDVFGFADIDTDWSRYRNVSDSGVLHEVHETRTGRAPTAEEISRFRRHFVGLLTQASRERAFAAITGAPQLLSTLARSAGHRVSLATGAWSDSARLKMASAGMCFDDYPSATGDDAADRESIIRLSRKRAVERYGEFSTTIYVGDGVWDARACRSVGIPFIGIGVDGRATRLKAEGAIHVFPDFKDANQFLSSLNEIANATLSAPVAANRE